MIGQWRVEVSPGSQRKEDCFLHVIQVGDQKLAAMDKLERIADAAREGVRITLGERRIEVRFATSGDLHMELSPP